MTEVVLDRACVLAVIRKLVSARVAQHMWMDGERDTRALPGSRNQLADGRCSQRSFSFADKHESCTRMSVSQVSQIS